MNERYTFVSLLSQKPDLSTWLVFDEVTRQTCIAKSASVKSKLHLHQLKTEIQILSKLKGQSFCTLLDVISQKDQLILIEQKIDGITLDAWLKTKPDRRKRRQIFSQIVRLIQKVHEAGYVYMDLKADNILISQNKAWLIDFNSCIPAGSSQVLMANLDSLPPEYHRNRPITEKADQIGLGRLYRKMLGPGWVFWRCIQKNPDRRFGDLDHLLKALRPSPYPKAALAFGAAACVVLVSLAGPAGISSLASAGDASIKTTAQLAAFLKDEQASLYGAALKGDLDSALYQKEETFLMMALWAIEQNDPLMARHLLDSMSEQKKKDLYYLALPLRHTCGDALQTRELESLFRQLAGSQCSAQSLQAFFSLLFVQEIILHEPEQISALIQKPGKWSAAQAVSVMEYLLLLKSKS